MTYTPYLIPVSVKGIIIENGKVWLRKNERDEWELPGGKIDPREQPEETVLRELSEELGFTSEVEGIIDAYIYTINESVDESLGVLVICYLCTISEKSGEFELIGEAGQSEFKEFSLDEVYSLNMPEFYKKAITKASNLN